MTQPGAVEQFGTEQARALLMTVRAENEADLAAARATLDGMASDGTASSGNMTDVVAAASHMVADAEGILIEVDAALARIDAGTYGTCAQCGSHISDARLELRPYVRTCVGCAS